MAKLKRKSISLFAKLRNYFITGIVVLIPIGITLYLTKFFISVSSKLIPYELNPNTYLPFAIPGLEIILAIIFITLVGSLSLSFIGKKILQLVNDLFKRIPILRTIYSAIGQMTETFAPKKGDKKSVVLTIVLLSSVISIYLILNALNKNILYFNSPSDIRSGQDINFNKKIRVGGMVKKNTLEIDDKEIRFIITDFKNEIQVSFKGTIPNLFAEGKGVVAEGKLQDKKFFIADRILAKHDENYMPPELKNIMKENAK